MGEFRILRWALLFVVLVIFASGAVAFYTVFFDAADDVTMPLLRETSIVDAVKELERLGFSARALKIEQVASSLPSGRILAQSPEAGLRVRRETAVLLHVSKVAARRAVPEVRGLVTAQAQNVIQEQGFEIGDIVYIKDDSRPAGTVIAQNPAAPATVPGDKKIDLLINQTGAGAGGKVLVPDVARMTERQARGLLEASGLKIAAVESVYSPNATEGHVIATRPEAGKTARAGDGVRLRVATAKRPEGVPEPPVGSAPMAVRVPGYEGVTPSPDPSAPSRGQPRVILNPSFPEPSTALSRVTPPAPAVQENVSQGTPQPQGIRENSGSNASVSGAPSRPAGGKIAKIRYQVPPLTRPLNLKIELVDPSGMKVLLDRNAKGGEFVSLDASYSKECAVTIYLGGEFVWQDRYM